MNPVLEWLSGGDLRSDGMANEVAAVVLRNPQLFEEMYGGLLNSDDLIRGRTADALEKISRSNPEYIKDHVPELIRIAKTDSVAMVRMHLAMIFGHLAIYADFVDELAAILLSMLDDKSVFAKSWAIVSLCIIARKYPEKCEQVTQRVAPLHKDTSIAIRTKVRYALEILTDMNRPFPKGWIKSEHLQDL
jgi:HEAT repeat protein